MSKYILFTLLLFVSLSSRAELNLSKLSKIAPSADYLSGNFEQQKYLADLDAQITSSGLFNYQRGQSIHWETLKPIQNILLMTPQSITNSQNGREIMSLKADTNPVVKLLSTIFFSVLTADWQSLAQHFELKGSITANHWSIQLTPKDKNLLLLIKQVNLEGAAVLQKATFFEQSGDRTTITFSELAR